MISKARIKLIQSLADKKYRSELKLFVVEGKKQVAELLTSSLRISFIAGTTAWLSAHRSIIKSNTEILEVTPDELKKISFLQTPQEVLALVELPNTDLQEAELQHEFCIALDEIQDPGNLGTIIRTADWYGIKHIVCSPNCADVFNPKTIQATMGSFMRVKVWYAPLQNWLTQTKTPIYGALLTGKSVYETKFTQEGILLIGNEGRGISSELQPLITHPVHIPKIGGAESLNAAIATAIICDNRARNII